jgi:hypothetical protein
VIEVGAGSGANFSHYPSTVSEVVAVEPESYLRKRAQRAAAGASVPDPGHAPPMLGEINRLGSSAATNVQRTPRRERGRTLDKPSQLSGHMILVPRGEADAIEDAVAKAHEVEPFTSRRVAGIEVVRRAGVNHLGDDPFGGGAVELHVLAQELPHKQVGRDDDRG